MIHKQSNMNECENPGPLKHHVKIHMHSHMNWQSVGRRMHTQKQSVSFMWCVGLYSKAREVVFTPSVLVPGEQRGEKVPSVHSLSNGLYSFPLCVFVHVCMCVYKI